MFYFISKVKKYSQVVSGFILEILSFESFSQETVLVQGHPGAWNFLDVDLHSLTESHVHPWGSQGKAQDLL